MKKSARAAGFLFIALSLIDVIPLCFGIEGIHPRVKPFLILSLAAAALFSLLPEHKGRQTVLLSVGMALHAAGDIIGRGIRKSKNSSIVLVSEKDGGAMHYAERVRQEYPEYNVKVSILGHLQRGGSPTAYDRILASRLGVASIEALKEGQRNIMVGIKNDQIVYVPISRAIKMDKPIDKELINVLNTLSI